MIDVHGEVGSKYTKCPELKSQPVLILLFNDVSESGMCDLGHQCCPGLVE
jgi:hypothetical protein